ncbi:hypothetical protein REK76_29435 (plasmid) [Nocardia farcinica]|uniref:hypothetical protein n=1 Tax=Nocardia farcinica TaxID=37329 RepID=UPI001893D334|nr:hypothetical protein [Nocardia farcinica]MBF6284480.1 hypothetical protein [Nocardia farcinica]
MARERVVHVPVVLPAPSGGGGRFGGVGAMFVLFACVVAFALLVLVAVVVMFDGIDYSTVPATRELGPCEPFCSLRTTTAPVGGEQR